MLTRLEIDNFRCFEGFVWEPGPKVLILGANGCGKSSMMDALVRLKSFVAGDARVEELFPLKERTKGLGREEQTFSLQAQIDGVPYCYRLVVGTAGDPVKLVVQSEILDCGQGAFRVSFEKGQVTIRHPKIEVVSPYELKANRSVLSSLNDDVEDYILATRFSRWMEQVRAFRLNPFSMDGRSAEEVREPEVDLSNYADWYRWLNSRVDGALLNGLFKSLGETFEGFASLSLQNVGRDFKLLDARFRRRDGALMVYGFEELSEGQRCLVCLYTILHFVLAGGGTVIIDEPEDFVSLREIQPWLKAASRVVSEAGSQLILISHNPELIDQWAPAYGVRFVRDGIGPVKVEAWHGEPESGLSPSQLIARGWDDA